MLKNFSSTSCDVRDDYFNGIQKIAILLRVRDSFFLSFFPKFLLLFKNKKKNFREKVPTREKKKKEKNWKTMELIVHEARKSWTFSITSCTCLLRELEGEGIPSIRRVSSRLGDTPGRFRPVFAGLDPWRSSFFREDQRKSRLFSSSHSIFLNRILRTVWWRSYIYKFLKEEIDFFYIPLFRDRVWIIIYNVEIISSQIIISTLCHLYNFSLCTVYVYT